MFVVLHSDFGASHYVSEMAGSVYKINPDARVILGAQDLPPFNPDAAGFLFRALRRSYPSPAIHVVVVDPGVGSSRRELLVELKDGSVLIGPDNGVLYPAAEEVGIKRIWSIEKMSPMLPKRDCETFHGRDVFSPAAALLTKGVNPEEFCVEIGDMIKATSCCEVEEGRLSGIVIYIDGFGNCVTNIPSEGLEKAGLSFGDSVKVQIGKNILDAMVSLSYLGIKGLMVIPSSHSTLEISLDRDSAAARYTIKIGNKVEIRKA